MIPQAPHKQTASRGTRVWRLIDAALEDRAFIDRFWAKVNVGAEDDCWEWTGPYSFQGYGRITPKDGFGEIPAHRFSLMLKQGPLGKLYSCHKCDNPKCCNPQHLFAGTCADNVRDCVKKGRRAEQKRPLREYCSRGHEMKATGAYVYGRSIVCAECKRQAVKRLYYKRKEAKA